MFGLFKRTKIEDWEIDLLNNVLSKLPDQHSQTLLKQIEDGLLKGVLTNVSDIPGYIAFTYNPEILKKYDNKSEKDFKLTGIKVFDQKSSTFLKYTIYISSGTISGYSIECSKKCKVDVDRIDISDYQKIPISSDDYYKIENILNSEEKKLINPSEIFIVTIDNKEYFHLKDLEDGDFIGIDRNKKVYEITHDPLKITVLQKELKDVL
jgi:hypothetical protein